MKHPEMVRVRKDFFAYVAFWQFMSFMLLLCLIWIIELRDLPAVFFASGPTPFNLIRACVLSAAVILIAIITVAHTHVQQKVIAKDLLVICSRCGRIRVNPVLWEQTEKYVVRRYGAILGRAACPECYHKMTMEDSAGHSGS